MNNPEVTMHDIGNGNRFEVQEKAIRAAGIAIKLAMKVPAPLRSIPDRERLDLRARFAFGQQ